MKKITLFLTIITIVSIVACSSCKKNSDAITFSSNITLYDKPLNTIQQYITGNWKLIYTDGGYTGVAQYFDSIYWQLSANRIKQIYQSNIFIDTTINWIWVPIGGAINSNVLQCFDYRSYPYNYVVMRMYKDTLILHDNFVDGLFYHFIKNK